MKMEVQKLIEDNIFLSICGSQFGTRGMAPTADTWDIQPQLRCFVDVFYWLFV
jgi:hypothetical protein